MKKILVLVASAALAFTQAWGASNGATVKSGIGTSSDRHNFVFTGLTYGTGGDHCGATGWYAALDLSWPEKDTKGAEATVSVSTTENLHNVGNYTVTKKDASPAGSGLSFTTKYNVNTYYYLNTGAWWVYLTAEDAFKLQNANKTEYVATLNIKGEIFTIKIPLTNLVLKDNNGKQYYPHEHAWNVSVSASGNTVTATCGNSGCPFAAPTVTLNASSKTWDGTPQTASLAGDATFKERVVGSTVGAIAYWQGTTPLGGAPYLTGDYTAKVNVTFGGQTYVAMKDFSITPPSGGYTKGYQIGTDGLCYNTWNEAVEKAADGATILVHEDVNQETVQFDSDNNVTADFGGHKLTNERERGVTDVENLGLKNNKAGTVTIKNAEMPQPLGYVLGVQAAHQIDVYGNFTFGDGVNMTNRASSDDNRLKVSVKRGTVTFAGGQYQCFVSVESGTLKFSGGKFWGNYRPPADNLVVGYVVKEIGGDYPYEVIQHQHNWTCEDVVDSTFTATCSADGGACPYKTQTLTISNPSKDWDGNAAVATLSYNATQFKEQLKATVSAVTYEQDGQSLPGAPYLTGSYVAKATVTVGGTTYTVEQPFEIRKPANGYPKGWEVHDGLCYNSLEEASTAAEKGATIYFRGDGTVNLETHSFNASKDVTVDLCGRTFTNDAWKDLNIKNTGSGTVTLVNGTIKESFTAGSADPDLVLSGKFVFGDGLLIKSDAGQESNYLRLNVASGSLKVVDGARCQCNFSGDVTITGGYFWNKNSSNFRNFVAHGYVVKDVSDVGDDMAYQVVKVVDLLDLKDAAISYTSGPDFAFDTKAHKPVIASVTVPSFAANLREGSDYTVEGLQEEVGSPKEDCAYSFTLKAVDGGLFTGSKTVNWKITTMGTTESFSDAIAGAGGTASGKTVTINDSLKLEYAGDGVWVAKLTAAPTFSTWHFTPTGYLYFENLSKWPEGVFNGDNATAMNTCGISLETDSVSFASYKCVKSFTWNEGITVADALAAAEAGETKIVRTLKTFALPYSAGVGDAYNNEGGIRETMYTIEVPLENLVLNDDKGVQRYPEHTHAWSYKLEGNVLTATCSTEGCPCQTLTLTLNASSKAFDGGAPATAIDGDATRFFNQTGLGVGSIAIERPAYSAAKWYKGDYTASVTIGDYTLTKSFAITKPANDYTDGYEVKSSGVRFDTWAEAVANAQNGDTIVAHAYKGPHDMVTYNFTSDRDVVVDLCACTLKQTKEKRDLQIVNNGKGIVTLTNGTFDQPLDNGYQVKIGGGGATVVLGDGLKCTNRDDNKSDLVVTADNVKLQIVGGQYTANFAVANGGALEISGGQFWANYLPTALKSGYVVRTLAEGNYKYEVIEHEHDMVAEVVDASTIRYYCRVGGCDDAAGKTAKLVVADATYTGFPHEATVEGDLQATPAYLKGEQPIASAPVDAADDYAAVIAYGDVAVTNAFKILRANLADVTFALSATEFDYSAQERSVSLATLKLGDYALVEGKDFTFDAASVWAAVGSGAKDSTYDVTINAVAGGNFTGSRTASWTIKAPTGAAFAGVAAAAGGTLAGNGLTLVDGSEWTYYPAEKAPDGSGIAGWYAGIKVTLKDENFHFTRPGDLVFSDDTGVVLEKDKAIAEYVKSFTWWTRLTLEDLDAATGDVIVRTLKATALKWKDDLYSSDGNPETVYTIRANVVNITLKDDNDNILWPSQAYVAENSDSKKKYLTLSASLAAAGSGETVTLLAQPTKDVSTAFFVSNGVTLALGAYDLPAATYSLQTGAVMTVTSEASIADRVSTPVADAVIVETPVAGGFEYTVHKHLWKVTAKGSEGVSVTCEDASCPYAGQQPFVLTLGDASCDFTTSEAQPQTSLSDGSAGAVAFEASDIAYRNAEGGAVAKWYTGDYKASVTVTIAGESYTLMRNFRIAKPAAGYANGFEVKSNEVRYDTWAEAEAAAAGDDTIFVREDFDQREIDFTTDKNLAVDLCGKTLKHTSLGGIGGAFDAATYKMVIRNAGAGALSFVNGTIRQPKPNGSSYPIVLQGNGGAFAFGEGMAFVNEATNHDRFLTVTVDNAALSITDGAYQATFAAANGGSVAIMGGKFWAGPYKDISGEHEAFGAPEVPEGYIARIIPGDYKYEVIRHDHNWVTEKYGTYGIRRYCDSDDGCAFQSGATAELTCDGGVYNAKPYAATVTGALSVELSYFDANNAPLAGAPTNAGSYKVTMTCGAVSVEKAFSILPAAITEIVLNANQFDYDGSEKQNGIAAVRAGSLVLTAADYEVGGDALVQTGSATNTQTYAVTVTATGANFSGSVTTSWIILMPNGNAFKAFSASAGGVLAGSTLTLADGSAWTYYPAETAPDGSGKEGWYAGIKVTMTGGEIDWDDWRNPAAVFGLNFTKSDCLKISDETGVVRVEGSVLGKDYKQVKSFTWWQRLTIDDLRAAREGGVGSLAWTRTAWAQSWSDKYGLLNYHGEGAPTTVFTIRANVAGITLVDAGGIQRWPEGGHQHVWGVPVLTEGGDALEVVCTGCSEKLRLALKADDAAYSGGYAAALENGFGALVPFASGAMTYVRPGYCGADKWYAGDYSVECAIVIGEQTYTLTKSFRITKPEAGYADGYEVASNGVRFDTWAEAEAAAADGDTICVRENFDQREIDFTTDKTLTVDLCGKTLKHTSLGGIGGAFDAATYKMVIRNAGAGALSFVNGTIRQPKPNGSSYPIILQGNGGAFAFGNGITFVNEATNHDRFLTVTVDNAALSITDGAYEAKFVAANGGSVAITGGQFWENDKPVPAGDCFVRENAGEHYRWVVVYHEHDLVYSVDGDTITVVCTKADEGCGFGEPRTATLTVDPASVVYTGEVYAGAAVTESAPFPRDGVKLAYFENGVELGAAPRYVGTYEAVMSAGDKSVTKGFEITKPEGGYTGGFEVNGVCLVTWPEAVARANAGDTIIVHESFNQEVVDFTSDKDVTADLGGNVITYQKGSGIANGVKDLVLRNSGVGQVSFKDATVEQPFGYEAWIKVSKQIRLEGVGGFAFGEGVTFVNMATNHNNYLTVTVDDMPLVVTAGAYGAHFDTSGDGRLFLRGGKYWGGLYKGLLGTTLQAFDPPVADEGYLVRTLSEEKWQWEIIRHTHDFKYTVKGDTITVVCQNPDKQCDFAEPRSATLSVDLLCQYNGKPHKALVEATGDFPGEGWTLEYYQGKELLDRAPRDIGNYKAVLSAGGKSVTKRFRIMKYSLFENIVGITAIAATATHVALEIVHLVEKHKNGVTLDPYKGAWNGVFAFGDGCGYATFSARISEVGLALVHGTFPDGTKAMSLSKLRKEANGVRVVPVSFSKTSSGKTTTFGFDLVFDPAEEAPYATNVKPWKVTEKKTGAVIEEHAAPELLDCGHPESNVFAVKRLTPAVEGLESVEGASDLKNKLSYSATTGRLSGKLQCSMKNEKGKKTTVKAKAVGVMVNGVGYGTVTEKGLGCAPFTVR